MAKANFGCGRKECRVSTGICGEVTFGTGKLDKFGYWEFPCSICKNSWENEIEAQEIKFYLYDKKNLVKCQT